MMDGGNEAFASRFEKATGTRISFLQLTNEKLLKNFDAIKVDVFFIKWSSIFPDPEASLTPFQLVKSFELNSRRKEFERLRQEASSSVLYAERAEKYGKIADLIFDEALFLPAYQYDELWAMRKDIGFPGFIYRYSPMFSELELRNGD
jgi:ABC-type oligopeptide transport system substrate-binding subunit